MILHGSNYFSTIKTGLSGSKRNRLAVAFWGKESIEKLCISNPQYHEILCNLTMGGTNPCVIEELIKRGFRVRHSPRLHAKVFRFDGSAVVGSANASANGLAFEDNDLECWSELGVLVSGENELREIDDWLDKEFKTSFDIMPADLVTAKALYKRNRAKRPPRPGAPSFTTLLDALRNGFGEFDDRPIYLTCDTAELSRQGKKLESEIQQELKSTDFELYESWADMPRDAFLINFWDKGDGGFSFQNFYNTSSAFQDTIKDGSYQLVKIEKKIQTNTGLGELSKSKMGPHNLV